MNIALQTSVVSRTRPRYFAHKHAHRQTDRQTDRQTHTHTHTHTRTHTHTQEGMLTRAHHVTCFSGRCYANRMNLSRHRRSHTARARMFACEVCARTFSQRHHLQAHVRSHTGEKPYKVNQQKFSEMSLTNLSNIQQFLRLLLSFQPRSHRSAHSPKYGLNIQLCPGVIVRSPFWAKHHVVVQYMARWMKCPLPPSPSSSLPLPEPPCG